MSLLHLQFKSLYELPQDLYSNYPAVRAAGMVQRGSVEPNGLLRTAGIKYGLEVVALRMSNNKYTGQGAENTGNGLFNTISLP